jgi:two-component system, NtrC family, sensor kinase
MTGFSLHKQVLETLPDGITIQDRDFNIIYQNASMRQSFGQQIGLKCFAVYEKRDQICEGCGLLKAFETGQSSTVLRTAKKEDNSNAYFENSCFPLFDDQGNIIAGVEVCREVTDRVSLAEQVLERSIEMGKLNDQLVRNKIELETAYKELQRTHAQMLQREKMASIGQLASGIAHEINTPIQYVANNITFLQESFDELIVGMRQLQQDLGLDEGPNADKVAELHEQFVSLVEALNFEYLKSEIPLALDQSAAGIKRVAEIVLAMKNFAYSGGNALGTVGFDDFIHSVVEISRNAWKYVADLKIELADPPIFVRGHKGDLGLVLLNLIINAVDAITDTPKSGNELGQIRIQTRRNGKWGELLVEDSGCGIEPSLLTRIFEPFFTTKSVGKGTGQGLAIAYNIVAEAHKGELLVESKVGQGSTFIIRLPLLEIEA